MWTHHRVVLKIPFANEFVVSEVVIGKNYNENNPGFRVFKTRLKKNYVAEEKCNP